MIFNKLLSDIDGGKILDAGCGSGQFIEVLEKSLKSFQTITGIDVDEKSIGEARNTFQGNNYRFMIADSRYIPFEDESFDMVVISKALHHVEDPEATLTELKRILKTGGYFLINEMHRDQLTETQLSHMHYHHLRSEIDNALGISHNTTFYREDLINLGNNLNLIDKVMFEFIPDFDLEYNPQGYEVFIRKMDEWIPYLEGHPEKEKFSTKIESLKARIRKFGISRPPQMLILGRK